MINGKTRKESLQKNIKSYHFCTFYIYQDKKISGKLFMEKCKSKDLFIDFKFLYFILKT